MSNYEKRTCLYGLCSFSPVYHSHLPPSEVQALYIMIIQNFELTYVLHEDHNNETLQYLPTYVQTVANFMRLKKKISNSELFCLQKGVITMIKTFPKLPYAYHGLVVEALVLTLYHLNNSEEVIFNNFIENTIYQGVVWTCSHRHVSETELGESDKSVTVKSYFTLWKGLLQITSNRKYDRSGIFFNDRKSLVLKIVEKLVRSFLILVNKLNVAVLPVDNNATDIQASHKVAQVNDFAIFLNVVDFYQEMFLEIDGTMIKKCISKLIHLLIGKCIKYPFISGFYKLLSSCLKIANNLNYFNETNIASIQDITVCYQSLTKFLDILLKKIKQFKDDLLIACLQVLLDYPIIIIRDMLQLCVPAFLSIFYVGRSYIKLAEIAIATLEHWQNNIDADDMELFLQPILPSLDSYLQSKSLSGSSQMHQNRRKTAQMLKKRTISLEIKPELIKLQKRILNFIGGQNSSLCRNFVFCEDDLKLAVWGNEQHLKVTLPYEDIKLDMFLDKLTPRVVNLALSSSDRRTRITACELLQAIVMVFLGVCKFEF